MKKIMQNAFSCTMRRKEKLGLIPVLSSELEEVSMEIIELFNLTTLLPQDYWITSVRLTVLYSKFHCEIQISHSEKFYDAFEVTRLPYISEEVLTQMLKLNNLLCNHESLYNLKNLFCKLTNFKAILLDNRLIIDCVI